MKPWDDCAGDDGFHHYMSTAAKRAAMRHQRFGDAVPAGGDAASASTPGEDRRLVREVLLGAMSTPAALAVLARAPQLVGSDGQSIVAGFLRRGSDIADQVGAPIVSAVTVRPYLVTALDCAVRFQNFVPTTGSPRPSKRWSGGSCAGGRTGTSVVDLVCAERLRRATAHCDSPSVDEASLRIAIHERLRQRHVILPAEEFERKLDELVRAQQADAMRNAYEDVLSDAVTHFVSLVAQGLARADELPDATDRHVVRGYVDGVSAVAIAAPMGWSRDRLYKRFERIGQRIAGDLARRGTPWRRPAGGSSHRSAGESDV